MKSRGTFNGTKGDVHPTLQFETSHICRPRAPSPMFAVHSYIVISVDEANAELLREALLLVLLDLVFFPRADVWIVEVDCHAYPSTMAPLQRAQHGCSRTREPDTGSSAIVVRLRVLGSIVRTLVG